MSVHVAFIGFGEAGQSFAFAPRWQGAATAFDIRTTTPEHRADKLADYARCGVRASESIQDALVDTALVLSVVTADQAAHVARSAAPHIAPGTLYCDLNSVAPETKRAAAAAIEETGGRYVDVAVMAPVDPARLAVPLLISGPHAEAGAAMLRQIGFTSVRVVAGAVGAASAIKMIRSVMVKGIEALTAEMLLAADAADVTDDVLASLGADWRAKADYNLDRMLVHGTRRAAEMREVAQTLEALGVEPIMTRGTILRQTELGAIGSGSPAGLPAKLRLAA